MHSEVSETTASLPLRRSTRNRSVLSVEPTPRGPLKRTKRGSENKDPVEAVNGSRKAGSGSEDEESPSKKKRLGSEGDVGGSGDENGMDVQESAEDEEKIEDQETDEGKDLSHNTLQPKQYRALGDVNLSPCVNLGVRCQPRPAVTETKRVKPLNEKTAVSTKPATRIKSSTISHDMPAPKITSMDEYRRTMEAKARSSGVPPVNRYVLSGRPPLEKSCTVRQRVNNIPTPKDTVQQKKQGTKQTSVRKGSSGHSSRGFTWSWCFVTVLLVLLSTSVVLLAYKIVPVLRQTADRAEHPPRPVMPEKFSDYLSLLESRFPKQQPELWKRSRIHLLRHLQTAQPTEPVSLILTAGVRAERTLQCLAQGLASAFSASLNASVLHIDGASKSSQDSDDVKLDIDRQLRAAFDGDKPVAVVHRFEELPPGSTLIFYRYCDHETAAYKRVFLLFTVLLPKDEVGAELSLKDVEELVQDHVKEKLVGSNNQTAFNKMDLDKYGGLWSRISHLILPVVSEEEIEQSGC